MMPSRLSSLPPSLSTFGADPDLDTEKKEAEERDRSHTVSILSDQFSAQNMRQEDRAVVFLYSIIGHIQ